RRRCRGGGGGRSAPGRAGQAQRLPRVDEGGGGDAVGPGQRGGGGAVAVGDAPQGVAGADRDRAAGRRGRRGGRGRRRGPVRGGGRGGGPRRGGGARQREHLAGVDEPGVGDAVGRDQRLDAGAVAHGDLGQGVAGADRHRP